MSTTTFADRRSSKRSSKNNNFSIRFDASNNVLASCRRLEAERDFGILNSPTYGPPDLDFVLTGIISKHLDSGGRAAPRPHGLFRSSCQGARALIVDPLDRPETVTALGEVSRDGAGWKGANANAGEI